ncbi:uncharacterized protein [Oscarella lobularis]|uniref:uncharacterized protein isoform X2 n=1 Tax=Oscarella lobularis TaxID=121494 RepID=UPI00331432D7
MKTTLLELVHVLLLAAVVAGEGYVSSCEPHRLPENRGTLEYPPSFSCYDRNVDCTWKFQPELFFGVPITCDRMVATVEFLDTEKEGDILEIIDSSTNGILASLSGQSTNSSDFPKQYVACSTELTIRFKSNNNWKKGNGFKISYTTDRNMLNPKSISSGYVNADWTMCGSESRPACLNFFNIPDGTDAFYADVSNRDGDSKSVRITYKEGSSFKADLCGATTCETSSVLNGRESLSGDLSLGHCSKAATTYCNKGYQNYDDFDTRKCKYDGKWDRLSPPQCKEIKCSIPSIDNGHFIFSNENKSEYYDEEKIEWKCEKGYSHVVKEPDLFRFLPKEIEGKRRKNLFLLKAVNDKPPALRWRSTAIDYFRRTAGHMTCGANGWQTAPKCQPLECPKISLKNGSISTRRQIDFAYINGTLEYIDRRPHYLSTASFSCNHGFTLVGHSVATCMANSKWNVPLPKCLLETNLVKDPVEAFTKKFLLPLATYSRNAQPDKNFLGRHDRSDVLRAQSDVKLDLLFAFNIREKSSLNEVYKTFVNSTITNFPIDAEKTRAAVLVLTKETIWKFVGTPNQTEENPHNISENLEEFRESINVMFETALGGEPRDARRVAVIVSEQIPRVTNRQRALAALERYEQLNVKSLHISTRDLPHYMEPTTDFIEFHTTDEFHAFVNYSSSTTVDDLCGVAGAPGRHYPFSNFSVAARGAWPWLVTVLGNGEYECDGALVHRRWVVTGADCFKKATRTSGWLEGKINNYKIGVRVGQYELNDNDDGLTISRYNGTGVLVRGDHPPPGLKVWRSTRRFNPDTLENNMAVIRLDMPIEVSRFRKPICSPRHSEYNTMISDGMIAVGQTAFLVGYQYVKDDERVVSNVPIESSVVIANLSECRQRWPEKIILDSNLCVRRIPGDICHGATGTPLMCQDPKTNRYVLCGVGSFGFEDCKDGYAVYTNMRKYEEMIRDTVRMESRLTVTTD